MITTTQLLLTLFAITLSAPAAPLVDACDVMNPTTGTPRLCDPHPAGAPIYADTVCCDTQLCFTRGERGCLEMPLCSPSADDQHPVALPGWGVIPAPGPRLAFFSRCGEPSICLW